MHRNNPKHFTIAHLGLHTPTEVKRSRKTLEMGTTTQALNLLQKVFGKSREYLNLPFFYIQINLIAALSIKIKPISDLKESLIIY